LTAAPRLVLATTYPEPAALAIARAALGRGQLAAVFTPFNPSERLLAAARPLPKRLRREVDRRRLGGLPTASVTQVTTLRDLAQRAVRVLPRTEAIAQRLEDSMKAAFDRSVAARLDGVEHDAVIGISGSSEMTLRAASAAGRLGILHLTDSHPAAKNRYLRELGGLPAGHPELVAENVRTRMERELEEAGLVLVPSRLVADQLAAAGVPADRIDIEARGVNVLEFSPPALSKKSSQGNLRCLFVGQVCHRKGIRFLLEASRRLAGLPVTFRLVGPMRSNELMGHLPASVTWKGSLGHQQIADEMRRADVLVLPSLEDAFGLVTMEAMASGLPVVVSDHCGSSELVADGAAGIVIPAADTTALVNAIRSLLEQPDRRRAMGREARRRMVAGRSWESYGQCILDRIGRHATRAAGMELGLR
jgi:glycosyltransferase involved in cell wall biosynthesis